MSATNEERQAAADPAYSPQDLSANGSGRIFGILLMLVLFVGIAGGAGYYGWRAFRGMGEDAGTSMLTHKVERTDLLISITEDGNVESASNVDLKCQVAGGSSILWIIEDGSQVKKGDELVRLDSSQLEDQINQQRITYEKARSAMVQAEKDYQVAQISVKEYLEGVFVKELQDADAQVTIAMENLRSAQNTLEYSQRMFRKGYISSLDLESQQFAVQRAQLELDSAQTAKDVLTKYTKAKMLEDLDSQVETAKAKMESEKAAFALEETRLKRLEDQLEHCVITAPQDGMVVYANEMGSRFRGSQAVTIEEGAAVRERQTIIRLPDLKKMQVKVNVHESKVEQLALNMRASIRILDRVVKGSVDSIASQPEPTSFFQASVKEYATVVRIDGEPKGLKPGMTAEVEILVADLKDVITLPVAAVVEQRGGFFCWVKTPGKVERRPLVLGHSNEQFVEVKDGVREGDEVILNPRAVISEARSGENERAGGEPADAKDKFGESPASTDAPASGGPPSPRKNAGGDRPGGPPGGPDGGRGRGSGRGAFNPTEIFNRMDANGDGKLSSDEMAGPMADRASEIDTDGDGEISLEEFQARMRSFGGGRGGPGRGESNGEGRSGRGDFGGGPRGSGGFGGGGFSPEMIFNRRDENGDGKLTGDEISERMAERLDEIDANGDGEVSLEEFQSNIQSRFGAGGGGSRGGPGGP